MNKIVDRPTDATDVAEHQTTQTASDVTDTDIESSDSIVTYRTEPSVISNDDVDDQLDELIEAAPVEALVETGVKDTLSEPTARAPLFLLGAIIACSVAGGYMLGQMERPDGTGNLATATGVQNGTYSQGIGINGPTPESVVNSAASSTPAQAVYTTQLGEMRAELLRLHAIFIRLATIADLDDGEFDLESPLLDWQEQSNLSKMGLLNRRIAHMSDSSDTLTSIFNLRRMAFDQKISGKPIVEGSRSSGFGYREDPITGERVEHLGLDYSGPVGEPILALADGIVTFSGKNSGYGNLVELEHVDGLKTRYAHNQANLVKRGARVKKGQAIATLGSTGRSTGPHVHVEVRLDGQALDPGFFIR